jgi:hypothetical protein
MRDGADVTLFLPTDELAAIPARPNAPAKRRKPMLEHPALDLYAGNAKYLVRTAIIRSEDWNSKAPTRDAPTIRSSRDIAELTAHLAYADQEHMVSIALNNSMKLLAIHEVAVGHTSGVSQELRHIVKVAFLTSASVMAVVQTIRLVRPLQARRTSRSPRR